MAGTAGCAPNAPAQARQTRTRPEAGPIRLGDGDGTVCLARDCGRIMPGRIGPAWKRSTTISGQTQPRAHFNSYSGTWYLRAECPADSGRNRIAPGNLCEEPLLRDFPTDSG